MQDYAYLLAIDTCGPTGSVALGQQVSGELRILGEKTMGSHRGSAELVSSVCELLSMAEVQLPQLSAIVAVNGPGSFTGVRVGLAAVKGLAESAQIPVVAVSRLEVLAHKAGIPSAALDAHRNEIFLRIGEPGTQPRELLAGNEELAAVKPAPKRIAVCDEAAAALLAAAWPSTELVRTRLRLRRMRFSSARRGSMPGSLLIWRCWMGTICGGRMRRSLARLLKRPKKARNPEPVTVVCPCSRADLRRGDGDCRKPEGIAPMDARELFAALDPDARAAADCAGGAGAR
jgi:tRNA threonylcarbamoyladenosine biosynthesis protein TsaB